MFWAKRSKKIHLKNAPVTLFGIMQGSTFKDLREFSAQNQPKLILMATQLAA